MRAPRLLVAVSVATMTWFAVPRGAVDRLFTDECLVNTALIIGVITVVTIYTLFKLEGWVLKKYPNHLS